MGLVRLASGAASPLSAAAGVSLTGNGVLKISERIAELWNMLGFFVGVSGCWRGVENEGTPNMDAEGVGRFGEP